MSFIWVIFSKIKQIMNVNRRIILVLQICYTDPDLCERCFLRDFTYLTGF